jgi:hypothetical protein
MIHFKQQTDNVYKIYLDSILIGYISNLSDFYEVSVCYYDFTVLKSNKRFILSLIKNVYETNRNFLEAERNNIPIRINGSLEPMELREYSEFKIVE